MTQAVAAQVPNAANLLRKPTEIRRQLLRGHCTGRVQELIFLEKGERGAVAAKSVKFLVSTW